MAYSLPALPYAYDALEPNIDTKTMEIHHSKHHQTYINNINGAIAGTEWEKLSVEDLVAKVNEVPTDLKNMVINNAGGHANHSLFWTVMSPQGGGQPTGAVAKAIDEQLGGFDAFKDAFTKAAISRFGSGWAWLSVTPEICFKCLNLNSVDFLHKSFFNQFNCLSFTQSKLYMPASKLNRRFNLLRRFLYTQDKILKHFKQVGPPLFGTSYFILK